MKIYNSNVENFDFDFPRALFRVSVNDVLSIDLGGEFLRRNKFFFWHDEEST